MANQPSWAAVTASSTALMHAADRPHQPLPFPTAQVPTHLTLTAPNDSLWADGRHSVIGLPLLGERGSNKSASFDVVLF